VTDGGDQSPGHRKPQRQELVYHPELFYLERWTMIDFSDLREFYTYAREKFQKLSTKELTAVTEFARLIDQRRVFHVEIEYEDPGAVLHSLRHDQGRRAAGGVEDR
jgi:hypothetical protein